MQTEILWETPYQFSKERRLGFSYREVLLCTHKHNHGDWQISFGKIIPMEGYKDYKVEIYVPLFGGEWKTISKSEIMYIGSFPSYGYISDENNLR